MALTIELEKDGVVTHDLTGATFAVRDRGLNLGNPTTLRSMTGNIFQDGTELLAHSFTQRRMSLPLRIAADTPAELADEVQKLTNMLRQARSWAISRGTIGNKWRLKMNVSSGSNVYFTILDGDLTIPPIDWERLDRKTSNPVVGGIMLTIMTDPLGEGDSVTVANFARDASFETAGTALADHTDQIDATGTAARDVTKAVFGNASLKLIMTDSTAGQEWVAQRQDITVVAAEVYSLGIYGELTALSSALLVMMYEILDSAGNVLLSDEDFLDTVSTAGIASLLSREAVTIPAGGVTIRLYYGLRSTDVDATGTAFMDGIMIRKASTLGDIWVSGRELENHFDDDGQLHQNHITLEDIPGDFLAKLQLKFTEGEAHTKFWAGARHGSRRYDDDLMHEGEDFLTFGTNPSGGADSGGAFGQDNIAATFDAITASETSANTTATLSHTMAVKGQRLIMVGVVSVDTGGADTPDSVTYGAVALAELGSKITFPSDSEKGLTVFFLAGDTVLTGANDMVATFGSSQDRIQLVILSFYGVDPTTPLGSSSTGSSSASSSMSAAVGTATGELVVDFGIADTTNSAYVVGADQTARINHFNGAESDSFASTQAGVDGGVMSWSWSLGADGAMRAVSIKPFVGTASSPNVRTLAMTTPPLGAFRVLARLRNPDGANIKVKIGHTYGGITVGPSTVDDYEDIPIATTEWHIKDIGSLIIPPSPLPDGATVGTFTLNINYFVATIVDDSSFQVDWLFLLPVDEGSAFTDKTLGTDVVVLDTISRLIQLQLWNTTDVYQSSPAQEGSMIFGSPDGTRVYVLGDEGTSAAITLGWTGEIRVIPRYLVIG